MESALAFAGEVSAAAPQEERADMWLLERISRVVGLEDASYAQLDGSSRFLHHVNHPGPRWAPTEAELQLASTQDQFCIYAATTGDQFFTARRLSDVVDLRGFRQTECFETLSDKDDRVLTMRLPGEPGTHWTLYLIRRGPNYTRRDVLLLDTLRPFLIAYESRRSLAAKFAALQAMHPVHFAEDILSVRENEVMDLVAKGASNAEIAEKLWISPGTARKHLENIYLKLDVGSRTAALARTGRAAPVPEAGEARDS